MEDEEYLKEIAQTIWEQILSTTEQSVINSWGLQEARHDDKGKLCFVLKCTYYKNQPSIYFKVNGLLHKGLVIISLDEGADLYNIYLIENKHIKGLKATKEIKGVYCDQLAEILDKEIERGNMTDEEYQKKCEENDPLYSLLKGVKKVFYY